MKSLLFLSMTFVTLGLTSGGLTAFQMKLRVSKAQCKPATGYSGKLVPCYDFKMKSPIPADECESPKNSHCCLYKCSCILKGAGTPRGIIPQEYKPLTTQEEQLLSDCHDGDSTTTESTTAEAASKPRPTKGKDGKGRSQTDSNKPVTAGNKKPKHVPSKPAAKKPTTSKKQSPGKTKPQGKQSKATKQPKSSKESKRNNNPNKPSRKPAGQANKGRRPTTKPTARIPASKRSPGTTASTKKPCTAKKAKKPSFSFGLLSRLSTALQGFGFTSKVTGPCA